MNNSKIILGTVQLGMPYGINNSKGLPSLDEAMDILDYTFEADIRLLDTAEVYGKSQEVIGAFHRKYPNKRFRIITKLAKDTDINILDKQVHQNLLKLGVDSLYGYMFHNFQTLEKNPKIYDELLALRKQGLIQKVGISLYNNAEIEQIVSNHEFDFIQIPFNLLDNHNYRGEVLLKAKKRNIEVHTRSVFLQGLFFKDIDHLPIYLEPLRKDLEFLQGIVQEQKISVEQLAMGYVGSKPYIDKFLIGVESIDQLKSNLSFYEKGLSEKQLAMIDEIHIERIELLNPSNWKIA
ncbi:aldo/keto reductase [Croceitalea sp. MTPC5]|uniref:aldo/keto reductase n=1 Tax=Croceitalea sp. MTPC5 TaxID=3056565 RepID=UPI002B3E4646|nr:aldo/keto reductase [Croceitalea sp. MTPC5]